MQKIEIRKATQDDLAAMQAVARKTIDACYRSFLGDAVDEFINSGQSDEELASGISGLLLYLQLHRMQ